MKSIPEKIADLLEYEDLNSEQIAEHIKLKEDPEENKKHIRTYINRALNYDLITVVRKKGRLNYYSKVENGYVEIHEIELKALNDDQKMGFYAEKYLRELRDLTELTEENSETMKKVKKFLDFSKRREEERFEVVV